MKIQHSTMIVQTKRSGKTTKVKNELVSIYGQCFQSNRQTFNRVVRPDARELRVKFYERIGEPFDAPVGWMVLSWLNDGEIIQQPSGEVITLTELNEIQI